MQSWVGKVGAGKVKHEDYNGNTNAKVAYFISKDRQDRLPAWQEPNKASSGFVESADLNDLDLPFN